MRADGQRTDRRITDGVTVAGGAGGQFHAELQRAARPVVDDHLLAEFAREFGGDDARDVVGRRTDRLRHDHAHRTFGIR